MGQFRPIHWSELMPGRNTRTVRLDDISIWWELAASCRKCRHKLKLERHEIDRHWGKRRMLLDLEQRLRCKSCNNNVDNLILVIGRVGR